MSNIKDLYVIDIKIIDERIAELIQWNITHDRTHDTLCVNNMIDELEDIKKSLKPLEPFVSDAFDNGYASDSHAEDKEQFLNNIKL